MKTGKEERGTKPKKHKQLHKTIPYHPLTSVQPQAATGPFQPPPTPVHVLSRAFCGMEYPFDQLGSAVLTMPSLSFLWSLSLAEHGALKSLCCWANAS